MKRYSKIVLFGFLVWLIPFIVSFAVFPLKKSMNPLFETIMAVVVTLVGVIFVYLYFKKVELNFFKEGILFGLVLFVMSIVIDLLLFMWGPMKMTFGNYMMDIGLTYLIYPIVSGGFGLLLEYKKQ